MTNPIIKHLANLKFYSDYKKSPTNSFDQYVDFIESGAPNNFNWFQNQGIPLVEKFKYTDPLLDSEFEESVEEYLKEEREVNNAPKPNSGDWYENIIAEIEKILEEYNYNLVIKENPFITLKELSFKYKEVQKLINIENNDFYHYTSFMQGKQPEDFFKIFSDNIKRTEDFPLIKCYPRIFMDCKGYAFFDELKKEIENPTADYSFIFYQMRNEKLIHFYCKDDYQELINKSSESVIEIYPESKVKNSKFKSKYSQIYQNMF